MNPTQNVQTFITHKHRSFTIRPIKPIIFLMRFVPVWAMKFCRMKHTFLSSLFTSSGLLSSIVNYLTRSTLAVASAAMQHIAAIASGQLALHLQVVYP